MLRISIYIYILISFSNYCQSQAKYDNIWRLGKKSGLDFTSGSPIEFTASNENIEFSFANVSICNAHGQFKFTSNGHIIANVLNDTMLNGNKLSPGYLWDAFEHSGGPNAQGVLAIPAPDDTNLYYLFHSGMDVIIYNPNFQLANKLYYSVIDASLDSGKGAVISKNNIVLNDTLTFGSINAVKHGNGRDWWIITKKYNSNRFYKILLSPSGLSAPSFQDFGPIDPVAPNFSINSGFSPDGSRFSRYFENKVLEIYDFNRCSGLFSNEITGLVNDSIIYSGGGLSFSPNNRYLYVSTSHSLFQFDLNVPAVLSSQVLIDTYDGTMVNGEPTSFFMHQLAGDEKIYVTTGTNVFHVINNPNNAGISCNFIQGQFSFQDSTERIFSTPNNPNYNLGPLVSSICDSLTSVSEVPGYTNTLTAYPNPFSSEITINIPNFKKQAVLIVYNVLGEKLKELTVHEQEFQLSLNTYPAGIYFLEAVSNGYSYKAKVLKQE